MTQERDLCMNCGRWREQHYSGGIFTAHLQPVEACHEYQGGVPDPVRRKRKDDDIEAGWKSGGFKASK